MAKGKEKKKWARQNEIPSLYKKCIYYKYSIHMARLTI